MYCFIHKDINAEYFCLSCNKPICSECRKEYLSENFCPECFVEVKSRKESEHILVTTTPNIEGHKIKEYFGVISRQVILSENIFKDIGTTLDDILGNEVKGYEETFRRARKRAIQLLIKSARVLGANALVGISFNFSSIKSSLMMVSVTGTAVRSEEDNTEDTSDLEKNN